MGMPNGVIWSCLACLVTVLSLMMVVWYEDHANYDGKEEMKYTDPHKDVSRPEPPCSRDRPRTNCDGALTCMIRMLTMISVRDLKFRNKLAQQTMSFIPLSCLVMMLSLDDVNRKTVIIPY